MSQKKPRSRKNANGDESDCPGGFTLEAYTRKSGEAASLWRCGELSQNPVTGEWRRCSEYMKKSHGFVHKQKGVHTFDIARQNDPGFPADFDERRQQMAFQQGVDQIIAAEARFAARANIPARAAGRMAMTEFVRDIASVTIKLLRTSPTFQASSIPAVSASTLTDRIRREGNEAFNRMIDRMVHDVHYVNLLTDAGTVLNFNTLHAVLTNPNFPDTILPLDTYENQNYTGEQYRAFFVAVLTDMQRRGMEIVAVICDNCPAQLNGLIQALASVGNFGIVHMPCLNHMINLVFTHILRNPEVARRIELLNEIIADLRTPDGIQIVGRKCPTLVKTRWIYAAEALSFILKKRRDVDRVRALFDHGPVPDELKTLYLMLLPLRLFSLSMEMQDRKLHEVVPVIRVTLRQFQTVCPQVGRDNYDILDLIVSHFRARVKINSFPAIVTAWVLSNDGRQRIRSEEKNFKGRFHYKPQFPELDCIKDLQSKFREQVNPEAAWDAAVDNPEQIGPSPDEIMAILAPIPLSEGGVKATAVAQQRSDFAQELDREFRTGKTLNEKLMEPIETGAYQTAKFEIRAMATALGMDPDDVIERLEEWLFTLTVRDVPTDPNDHWREVHSMGPAWANLARIGLRYASIGTSEASVERLLSEQKDVQGPHGVNFGTETLHARLVARHEYRPPPE